MSRSADGNVRTSAAEAVPTWHDWDYERVGQWRDATREMVLTVATAMAATDQPQSQGWLSITLTGSALGNDLLLADVGDIALASLGDHAGACSYSMRVVQMRLDMLSDLPTIRVLGRGLTEPAQLRLGVELTACNPHTDITTIMTCEYNSIRLDARTPSALLDFQLQHGERQR
jgi:hypothetical protein